MKLGVMISGIILVVMLSAILLSKTTSAEDESVSIEAILRSYVEDFRLDPTASIPWVVGIRITGENVLEWHVVVTGRTTRQATNEVTLFSGLPEEPTAFFQMDEDTLRAIYDGRMNALTAMSKEFSTDISPMSIQRMAGFQQTPDFWSDILPRTFHFWTTGFPERVPFGPNLTRETHGVGATLFYYEKGLRSSWIYIEGSACQCRLYISIPSMAVYAHHDQRGTESNDWWNSVRAAAG